MKQAQRWNQELLKVAIELRTLKMQISLTESAQDPSEIPDERPLESNEVTDTEPTEGTDSRF